MSKQSEAQRLAERARALHALSCLMQLVVRARAQTDIVTWQKVGGLEAENFLDALERGLPHPLLAAWEDVRAGNNRFAPSLRERQFRRLAVLLSVALHTGGLGKLAARKRTVKAFKHLMAIASHRAVERWELGLDPPLDAKDQKVIKAAVERCGPDPEALVRHFAGFVRFPQLGIDPRLPPTVNGDGNMLET
jgi:hypothetical protein